MADKSNLADELSRMKAEPILDVERTLVIGSLVLGVVLLAVLAWMASWISPGA